MTGEGCFFISIRNNDSIGLEISIGQNIKDETLIKSFINTFNCGTIYKNLNKKFIVFRVQKFEDIYNKMIPLFNLYKIRGVKYQDFLDFCKIIKLMNKKAHLSEKGLEKIKQIKSKMNRARY
jgi:hypothetical protein